MSRCCADPHGRRDHRRGGKPRSFPQLSKRIAPIRQHSSRKNRRHWGRRFFLSDIDVDAMGAQYPAEHRCYRRRHPGGHKPVGRY
jgi:hypothetical protein